MEDGKKVDLSYSQRNSREGSKEKGTTNQTEKIFQKRRLSIK